MRSATSPPNRACKPWAAVADFDHDGQLDLFLSALRGGASRLYRGRADGTFVDVTASAHMEVTGPARSCAWSDVDSDGWADLYVTSPAGGNFLFLNHHDCTFREIAHQAGVDLPDRESLGCAFGGVDVSAISTWLPVSSARLPRWAVPLPTR